MESSFLYEWINESDILSWFGGFNFEREVI